MVSDQPPTELERIEAPVRPIPAAAITPENPPLPDRRGDRAVQTLDVAPNVSVMEGDRKVLWNHQSQNDRGAQGAVEVLSN